MKRAAVVFALMAGLTLGIQAAVRGDVKVLEATDTIRYRINNLTKNYLLFYLFPHKTGLKKRLDEDLRQLNRSFRDIAVTTKDAKTKNLLAYFAYEKARITELLRGKPTKRNLSELLLMSETFSEGADTIARHHAYDFSSEEKMFMRTRSMVQRLEEILKYYIAQAILSDDPQIRKKLLRSVQKFDDELAAVNQYPYRDQETLKTRQRINMSWKTAEKYLRTEGKSHIPLVLDTGGAHIEGFLNILGIYHSKNQ